MDVAGGFCVFLQINVIYFSTLSFLPVQVVRSPNFTPVVGAAGFEPATI